MRFADRNGEAVWAGKSGPILTPESAAVARDITMAWLRSRGVSWRWIGLYLNAPHTTLKARFDQMPAELRDRYAAMVPDVIDLGPP